jgi:carbon monoxide dehydrogenase subunit G
MHGEEQIAAPVETVWTMLNDGPVAPGLHPELRAFGQDSDTEYTATVVIKIGPIRARFSLPGQDGDARPQSAAQLYYPR